MTRTNNKKIKLLNYYLNIIVGTKINLNLKLVQLKNNKLLEKRTIKNEMNKLLSKQNG